MNKLPKFLVKIKIEGNYKVSILLEDSSFFGLINLYIYKPSVFDRLRLSRRIVGKANYYKYAIRMDLSSDLLQKVDTKEVFLVSNFVSLLKKKQELLPHHTNFVLNYNFKQILQ